MNSKLQDSNGQVSIGGRAHDYARTHRLKQKYSNVVGGADNGVDQFATIQKYHLKGFEYGNWVSNNDRFDHLIAAQRSLKHLADIIGSENLGVNGNIGIAFGARGRGGKAAAHYEPRLNMVNLTKPSGAGCLAHEYGHALDFNFGSFIDQNKQYSALSGGWSTSRTLEDNVGCQLRAMMNLLLDTLIQTPSHQWLRDHDVAEYWLRRTEIFARFFEEYVAYKMKKISVDNYLTRGLEYYTHSRAYWSEEEIKKVVPMADKLCAELGKFLNGHGTLVTTPYPTGGKFVPVKKAEKKPVKEAATKKPEKDPKIAPLGGFVVTKAGKLCKDANEVSKWGSDNVATTRRVYMLQAFSNKKAYVHSHILLRMKNGQYYLFRGVAGVLPLYKKNTKLWDAYIHTKGELFDSDEKKSVNSYTFRNLNEAYWYAEHTLKCKTEEWRGNSNKIQDAIEEIYEIEYEFAKYPSRRGKSSSSYNWNEKPQPVKTIVKK